MSTRDIHVDEIKIGDKIEITTPAGGVFQGFVTNLITVTSFGPSEQVVAIQFRDGFQISTDRAFSYRLLFRERQLHTGDTISGAEVFSLPVGSHVRNIEFDMAVVTPNMEWIVFNSADRKHKQVYRADSVTGNNFIHRTLSGQYRIVYLPPWE
jgi:hypothetical protein